MKSKAIILLIAAFIAIGCGKEKFNPIFNDIPITGTWISELGTMVLIINNLKNEGDSEKYYEYEENGRRMLRRTYQNIPHTYEIVLSNGSELHLADKNGVYKFFKASK